MLCESCVQSEAVASSLAPALNEHSRQLQLLQQIHAQVGGFPKLLAKERQAAQQAMTGDLKTIRRIHQLLVDATAREGGSPVSLSEICERVSSLEAQTRQVRGPQSRAEQQPRPGFGGLLGLVWIRGWGCV